MDRIAEAVKPCCSGTFRSDNLANLQIWSRGADHADGGCLIIIVVNLGGVVQIYIRCQRVFGNCIVAITPNTDKITASSGTLGNLYIHAAEIIISNGQMPSVGDVAKEHIAFAAGWPPAVHGQPNTIGPRVDVGTLATGLG